MVSPNTKVQIEKVAGQAGDTIKIDKVMLKATDSTMQIGKPFIAGAVVEAKILKQARAKKILVFKYKAKSKYRRKQGHRQNYTEIEVTKI